MKNLLIFIFLALISSYAFAAQNQTDCKERILDGFGDSRHFSTWAGKILSSGSEQMDEQMAVNAASYVNQINECEFEISISNAKVRCSELMGKHNQICTVSLYYGYYVIFKDYVDTVHMVFNRWD